MTELKITESTQEIINQYKSDIQSAEVALNIAKKAANDIMNIVLFEAHINPNHIENLQILEGKFTFDMKNGHLSEEDKKSLEFKHTVDFKPLQDKDYEELGITKEETDKAINNIPNP